MHLLGRSKLQPLLGLNPRIDRWLINWVAEIRHATWTSPRDLFRQYPSAIHAADTRFLFRVPDASRGIETIVDFRPGITLIVSLKSI